MPTWKSTDEISKEIASLKDLRPKVRRTSMFGDDHREAISAQINVLEARMDADAIQLAWGDDTAEEFAQNVYDAAMTAHDWYTGVSGFQDGDPSNEWLSLVVA